MPQYPPLPSAIIAWPWLLHTHRSPSAPGCEPSFHIFWSLANFSNVGTHIRVGLLTSPFVAAADLILSATGDPSSIYLPILLFACSRYLLLNSVQPLLPYPVLPTILLAHSDAFLILASEDWLENEPPDDPPLESLLLNGLNIFWNIVAISDKVPNNPPSFFAGELPPELPETL